MEQLLTALLIWISANSDYPLVSALPTVEYRTSDELRHMQFCTKPPCKAEDLPQIEIAALFDHESRTLYLREEYRGRYQEHQDTLVHELIHYLQARAEKFGRYCIGLLEIEAYDLEDKWRVENGFPKIRRNPAIMMMADCGPGPT